MNLGCTLSVTVLIAIGALGLFLVTRFSLPAWVGFLPLGVVLAAVVVRGMWDYYRRPRLLSGGLSDAEINDTQRHRKGDANQALHATSDTVPGAVRDKEYQKLNAEHGGRSFLIEEDNPEVGWHLYILEGGRCTHDYLQDTLERAKEQARRQYGVPEGAWIEEKN